MNNRFILYLSLYLFAIVSFGCSSETTSSIAPDSTLPFGMGEEKGPCYPNHTCNEGLDCYSDLCVRIRDLGVDQITSEAGTLDVSSDSGSECTQSCVMTVVGRGQAGFQDGAPNVALLSSPTSVIVDSQGRLLIADRDNHRIRVFENGELKTLAGIGTAGLNNGPIATAQFNSPSDLVEAQGVIYVSDTGNNQIRMLRNGMVSLLAGNQDGSSGTSTYQNSYTSSTFYSPRGIARDGWGALYVTDYKNNAIRQLTGNIVYPFVRSANEPWGISVDSGDTVFFTKIGEHQIIKFAGNTSEIISGYNGEGFLDGNAATAKFSSPRGIVALDSGELYIADSGNNRIRKIDNNFVTTVAGKEAGYLDGSLDDAMFNGPSDIFVTASGEIYVADTKNHCIRLIKP